MLWCHGSFLTGDQHLRGPVQQDHVRASLHEDVQVHVPAAALPLRHSGEDLVQTEPGDVAGVHGEPDRQEVGDVRDGDHPAHHHHGVRDGAHPVHHHQLDAGVQQREQRGHGDSDDCRPQAEDPQRHLDCLPTHRYLPVQVVNSFECLPTHSAGADHRLRDQLLQGLLLRGDRDSEPHLPPGLDHLVHQRLWCLASNGLLRAIFNEILTIIV